MCLCPCRRAAPAGGLPLPRPAGDTVLLLMTVVRLQHLPSYAFTEAVSEALQPALPSLAPKELASVAFAMAKLHCRPEEPWMQRFLDACQVRVPGGGGRLQLLGWGTCLVACLAWHGHGRTGVCARSGPVARTRDGSSQGGLVGDSAVRSAALTGQANPDPLPLQPLQPWGVDSRGPCNPGWSFLHPQAKAPDFTADNLASLLWSVAELGQVGAGLGWVGLGRELWPRAPISGGSRQRSDCC